MIDELCELMRREAEAATALEGRLGVLESAVAADDRRSVGLALADVAVASDRLAALELARVLALATSGLPDDVAASDLVARIADTDAGEVLRAVVAELALATEHLDEARRRAEVAVAGHS